MLPAQQAAFSAPQVEQVRGALPGGFWQARPVPQVSLSQQTCVSAPHGVHMPAPPPLVSHSRLAPHSVWPDVVGQHGWPAPPQAVLISATHRPPGRPRLAPDVRAQPWPVAQVWAVQLFWPSAPQVEPPAPPTPPRPPRPPKPPRPPAAMPPAPPVETAEPARPPAAPPVGGAPPRPP